MIDCLTIARAGLHSQQTKISWCYMSQVWMVIEESAEPLRLWFCILHSSCYDLFTWMPLTGSARYAEMLRENLHFCLSLVKTLCPFLRKDGMMQEQTSVQQLLGTSAMCILWYKGLSSKHQSYHNSSISSLHPCHEQAKKREYGDRIREVENGLFTPPVFATTGGMGWEATLFYKCLVDEISEKRNPM